MIGRQNMNGLCGTCQRTSNLMIASFFEFSGIDDGKPLGSLVESNNEVVELGSSLQLTKSFKRVAKTTLVVENVNMELELIRRQVAGDAFSQLQSGDMTTFLSHCDEGWVKYCTVTVDESDNTPLAVLRYLRRSHQLRRCTTLGETNPQCAQFVREDFLLLLEFLLSLCFVAFRRHVSFLEDLQVPPGLLNSSNMVGTLS